MCDQAEPDLLLAQMVRQSPPLQEVFAQAARRHECSLKHPWQICFAMDEFTPGDKFRPHNLRKSIVFSMNFMELGPAALCHELTWLTPAVKVAFLKKLWVDGPHVCGTLFAYLCSAIWQLLG